jgi:hypothetical protein
MSSMKQEARMSEELSDDTQLVVTVRDLKRFLVTAIQAVAEGREPFTFKFLDSAIGPIKTVAKN